MKIIPMLSMIILFNLLLFPTNSYSLNIDRIDIEPTCNQEIYNQGNFKILAYLEDVTEMLENLKDENLVGDNGIIDTCHKPLFEEGAVEGLEILELSGQLGTGIETKCFKDFMYYNYYNQNPLTISIYKINMSFDTQSRQLSLQAYCKTKHIAPPPEEIFGTWISTSTNGDFYEKGQQIFKINSDDLSWEKETTYRFFWPSRSKGVKGTPSFYCRSRFKGFLYHTNLPSFQDKLISSINDSRLIYQLFFKVTEVELIDSVDNSRHCPQLVDEMNNTIGIGATIQLKKYGLNVYDYPLIPEYLQSILSVEIKEPPDYHLQKEKFKLFGKRRVEKVHPQTKGVILTFADEPSVEIKTLIKNKMKNLGLFPFRESQGVEYTSDKHFNVDRSIYRLSSNRAYQWVFRWLNGTRTRLETLNICRDEVSTFHSPHKNPPCEPYYAFESP